MCSLPAKLYGKHHCYPEGFNKVQKQTLRRKANDHFRIVLAKSFSTTVVRRPIPPADKHVCGSGSRFPRLEKDRQMILETCHASVDIHIAVSGGDIVHWGETSYTSVECTRGTAYTSVKRPRGHFTLV